MKFDWWLTGICFGRALSQTVTMVYAAALPVLQREWEMSAATAGAISSGYQIGYAVSLLVISSLADRIGARFLFIASTVSGAALTTVFAFFARDSLSALILYTLVALAIGGSYTTGLILLSEKYAPERRGRAHQSCRRLPAVIFCDMWRNNRRGYSHLDHSGRDAGDGRGPAEAAELQKGSAYKPACHAFHRSLHRSLLGASGNVGLGSCLYDRLRGRSRQ